MRMLDFGWANTSEGKGGQAIKVLSSLPEIRKYRDEKKLILRWDFLWQEELLQANQSIALVSTLTWSIVSCLFPLLSSNPARILRLECPGMGFGMLSVSLSCAQGGLNICAIGITTIITPHHHDRQQQLQQHDDCALAGVGSFLRLCDLMLLPAVNRPLLLLHGLGHRWKVFRLELRRS